MVLAANFGYLGLKKDLVIEMNRSLEGVELVLVLFWNYE